MREETKSHPIQILFNYWETRPTEVAGRLDAIVRNGVSCLVSFVPWQAIESDISHAFSKFLVAASERGLTLRLVLSPEVGVNYPCSGVPRDLLNTASVALDRDGKPIPVLATPQAFVLPSLEDPEFQKRYSAYLARVDQLLADFEKMRAIHSSARADFQVVFTSSWLKFYRTVHPFSSEAFRGAIGDYSEHRQSKFKKTVDSAFLSVEFQGKNPEKLARWKAPEFESILRDWFETRSENQYRDQVRSQMNRKSKKMPAIEVEWFAPEYDPSLLEVTTLGEMTGLKLCADRFANLLHQFAQRRVVRDTGRMPPWVYWGHLQSFRHLSDSEKQWLILQTLLRVVPLQGSLVLAEEEWFALSKGFRARTEALAEWIASGEIQSEPEAVWLTQNLWSATDSQWDLVTERLLGKCVQVAQPSGLKHYSRAKLIIADSEMIFSFEVIQSLLSAAQRGALVIIPKSPLISDSARKLLESALTSPTAVHVDQGVRGQWFQQGVGTVVVYDPNHSQTSSTIAFAEHLEGWAKFAQVEPVCRSSDSRIRPLVFERAGGGHAVFIVNSSSQQVTAQLFFTEAVTVCDLQDHAPEPFAPTSKRFGLDVPAWGVLPVAVYGLREKNLENDQAQESESRLVSGVTRAAWNELPGLDEGDSVWN